MAAMWKPKDLINFWRVVRFYKAYDRGYAYVATFLLRFPHVYEKLRTECERDVNHPFDLGMRDALNAWEELMRKS